MANTEQWVSNVIKATPLLTDKIVLNTPCDHLDMAEQGLLEVIRFMYLCAHTQSVLTPSALVDAVWHEFILFTRSYENFCTEYLGQFVHHQPSKNQGKELFQYQQTLAQYQQYFGASNAIFWPQANEAESKCGACENV